MPVDFHNQDRAEAGQIFDKERLGRGEYRLFISESPKNQGLIHALLACPTKGWFVPVESESINTLKSNLQ